MPSDKRNILFLTLRADFGGGPEHLWQLLKNMPEDMSACVACPEDYPYFERYCDCVGKENVFVLPHRAFSLKKLWALRAFCRARGVVVLHSHGKGAGLYSRLLAFLTGIPCVHTFHGVHVKEYGPLKKALYCLAEKCMGLFTRKGIAVSGGEREQILAEGLLPETKLTLIENGVPVSDDTIIAQGPPFRVVSISRFDAAKHSDFIIPILAALRQRDRLGDFSFIVVGDGPGRTEVENAAREQGLADFLTCVGATSTPHSFFSGALCYLSTSRWEGMPLAVLEAMAHGLAPVVTDVVGNRDVVDDGVNGFVYREEDAAAAADALCRLADNPELRQSFSENARAYVRQRHDVCVMSSATYDLLRELMRSA